MHWFNSDFLLEIRQIRAYKNWTVKQFHEVERFIDRYRRCRKTEGSDEETISDQVTELMEFKFRAEKNIRELLGKLKDEVLGHEEHISTPVTANKNVNSSPFNARPPKVV